MDATEIDNNFPEMMESLIEHRQEKISDDYEGTQNYFVLFNGVMKLSKDKQRTTAGAAIVHAKTTQMGRNSLVASDSAITGFIS